jgi:hypothetical protein
MPLGVTAGADPYAASASGGWLGAGMGNGRPEGVAATGAGAGVGAGAGAAALPSLAFKSIFGFLSSAILGS